MRDTIKSLIWGFILLFALTVSFGGEVTVSFASDNSPIATRILSVTVYPQMALIKKDVSFNVKRGENNLVISGITPELIDNSIQVRAKYPSLSILEVRVSESYLNPYEQKEVKEFQERLNSLERQIALKMAEREAIKGLAGIVEKFSPSLKESPLNSQSINSYFELVEKILLKTSKNIAVLDEELKKLNKEKESIEKELKNYGTKKEQTKSVAVTLYSKTEQKASIELSYLVSSAGWRPGYDLRADSNSGKVTTEYIATITQKTGEDWKGAEITVSTAKPVSFRDIPELNPWYVDRFKPVEIYRRPIMLKSLEVEKSLGMKEELEEQAQEPVMKEELTSVSFTLPAGINIPADGKIHRVVLASQIKEAKMKYITVPKLSPYAYLKADFENPFTFPMLAGDMNIYLDGRFAGTIAINKTLYPSEKRDIPLGIDEGIKVERKLEKKFTEYSGVITKETSVTYEYLTTITNGKSRDIEIELKDSLPVSRNEKIKIEIHEPKDKSLIKEDGSYTLNINLKSKETFKNRVSFTITYPRDWSISGVE